MASVKVLLASDSEGAQLRQHLIKKLRDDVSVVDGGISQEAAKMVQENCSRLISKEVDRVVLLSKYGVSHHVCANKLCGIRACVCNNVVQVKLGRQIEDMNVLCIATSQVKQDQAQELVETFLLTQFEPRFKERLEKLGGLELPPQVEGKGPGILSKATESIKLQMAVPKFLNVPASRVKSLEDIKRVEYKPRRTDIVNQRQVVYDQESEEVFKRFLNEMTAFKQQLSPNLLQHVFNEGHETQIALGVFELDDPVQIIINFFDEQLRFDLLQQLTFVSSNYTTKEDMLGILLNEAWIKKEARDWEKENINKFYKHLPQWVSAGQRMANQFSDICGQPVSTIKSTQEFIDWPVDNQLVHEIAGKCEARDKPGRNQLVQDMKDVERNFTPQLFAEVFKEVYQVVLDPQIFTREPAREILRKRCPPAVVENICLRLELAYQIKSEGISYRELVQLYANIRAVVSILEPGQTDPLAVYCGQLKFQEHNFMEQVLDEAEKEAAAQSDLVYSKVMITNGPQGIVEVQVRKDGQNDSVFTPKKNQGAYIPTEVYDSHGNVVGNATGSAQGRAGMAGMAGGLNGPGVQRTVETKTVVIPDYLYCPVEDVTSLKDFKQKDTYSETDMKNLKLYFSRLPKPQLLADMRAMRGILTPRFLVQAYNQARGVDFDFRVFKSASPQELLSRYFIGPPMHKLVQMITYKPESQKMDGFKAVALFAVLDKCLAGVDQTTYKDFFPLLDFTPEPQTVCDEFIELFSNMDCVGKSELPDPHALNENLHMLNRYFQLILSLDPSPFCRELYLKTKQVVESPEFLRIIVSKATGKELDVVEKSIGFTRAMSRYLKLNWSRALEEELKQYCNFEQIRKKYNVPLTWRQGNAALARLYPTDNHDPNVFETLMMLVLLQGGNVTGTIMGGAV